MSEKIAVSVNEAAELLGLGRDVTYRLVLGGEITSFKVGARRLVPVQAVRDYVERQTADAEQALASRIMEDVHGKIVRREGGTRDDRT